MQWTQSKACWCARVLSLAHAREAIRRSSEQPPTDSPVPFESNRICHDDKWTAGERGEACLPRRFVRTRALNEKSPFSARIGRDARDALYIAGWKLSFHLKSFREGIPMNLRLYAPMPLTTRSFHSRVLDSSMYSKSPIKVLHSRVETFNCVVKFNSICFLLLSSPSPTESNIKRFWIIRNWTYLKSSRSFTIKSSYKHDKSYPRSRMREWITRNGP